MESCEVLAVRYARRNIPGHDPLVMEAFAPLDDMEPQLGTRIVV